MTVLQCFIFYLVKKNNKKPIERPERAVKADGEVHQWREETREGRQNQCVSFIMYEIVGSLNPAGETDQGPFGCRGHGGAVRGAEASSSRPCPAAL